MSKKNSKKQKIYRMKGCSKTRKNYLGGSTNLSLAYTGKPIFSVPNPALAYTGKGGSSCGLSSTSNIPINVDATNPAYPNTGPVSSGVNTIYNNSSPQRGGCGCSAPLIGGGKEKGTSETHRIDCRCSHCKTHNTMKGGNKGIPYPDGLVGSPWKPSIDTWPGVNGIPGDSNYYSVNTYDNDVSRQMVDVGANRPFLNMKGGKKRKQKGGNLSSFIGQDLINLGRQFQFGVGSAYNALAGHPSPVNPLPWKDQLPTKSSFNSGMI
jgi:hypothetical protein